MLSGAITALVTPFKEGKLDEKTFEKFIEFQIKNGVSGIVPCGTTGESSTLSFEEHDLVIELAVKFAKKRVPVIAGTGSNSTQEAIDMTAFAKKIGADYSLQITPYYNRPTQEGLYRHFKAVAEAVNIPQILYNVPTRTGVNLLPETVIRLSELKNVVGIKEASGNVNQVTEILLGVKKKNFCVLSGDDSLTLPILALGGTGVISVASNVVPAKISKMVSAYNSGKTADAKKIHFEMYDLMKNLFIETNPAPAKAALGMMKMMSPELRLPLAPLSKASEDKLAGVLRRYKLIK